MAAARAPGDLSGEVPMSPYDVWWGPGSSPGELGAGAELHPENIDPRLLAQHRHLLRTWKRHPSVNHEQE